MVANIIPVSESQNTETLIRENTSGENHGSTVLFDELKSGRFYDYSIKSQFISFDVFLETIKSHQEAAIASDKDFKGLKPAFKICEKKYVMCWFHPDDILPAKMHQINSAGDVCTISPPYGSMVSVEAIDYAVVKFCINRKYPHVDSNNIMLKLINRIDRTPVVKLALQDYFEACK